MKEWRDEEVARDDVVFFFFPRLMRASESNREPSVVMRFLIGIGRRRLLRDYSENLLGIWEEFDYNRDLTW